MPDPTPIPLPDPLIGIPTIQAFDGANPAAFQPLNFTASTVVLGSGANTAAWHPDMNTSVADAIEYCGTLNTAQLATEKSTVEIDGVNGSATVFVRAVQTNDIVTAVQVQTGAQPVVLNLAIASSVIQALRLRATL